MISLLSDFRHAIRTLLKAPGFSTIVIVVLAMGIGANTAIFSVVNGVLLRPLPFVDSSRLVAIQSHTSRGTDGSGSFPDFADWKAQSSVIDRMAGYVGGSMNMTGNGEATSLTAAFVTSDLVPLLGATPMIGRSFARGDDQPGAAGVALVSESLWRNRFSHDPAIIGRGVRLDGQAFTIVGVMPSAFQFPIQAARIDLWLPFDANTLLAQWKDQRGAHFMHVLGRLRPGTTIEQAQSELTTISARLSAAYPRSNSDRGAQVVPLQSLLVHDFKLGLLVLMCAVAAVLLIACSNVANLLLARGMARQREMAIRSVLGASRARLVRQLLTESIIVAAAGGALGVLLALWGLAGLVAASPVDIPRLQSVQIDRSVLAFTTLVSLLTGVLFGLIPALYVSRSNAGEALKDAARGSSGAHSARTRQLLVVAEVALSLVLLAGAGLLIRSLIELRRVNPGFTADKAVAMELSLPDTRYPDKAAQVGFYNRLLAEMRSLPGVASSAISTTLPLSGNDMGSSFSAEGHPPSDPKVRPSAAFFAVSPEYFATMGIPVIRGRAFTERDDEKGPLVALIGETMARQYWPNEDPIGKRLTITIDTLGAREIVGIVGDVKQSELSEAVRPEVYAPYPQTPWPFMAAVVRAHSDPRAVSGALRAAVTRLDADQPPGDVKTMQAYLFQAIATPRFTASLVGSFAGLALLLAGFGLYGVMAYSVAQRRREIGIRMALGAQASDVRMLIVSQGLRMGVIGLCVGLAGALLATRVLEDLLFHVRPNDPATYMAVAAVLLAVLLAAAYLPARRATRLDPLVALRAD